MAKVSRRNFLSTFTSSGLILGLVKNTKGSFKNPAFAQAESSPIKIKKYNPLGKTGLKVSDVSCGTATVFEPSILRYAYDCGVNFFDTGEEYMRTKSETLIGQALEEVRDKVIICTKHYYSPQGKIERADIIRRVEASLKRMRTDYVDIAMVHRIFDISLLENEELLAAYSQLKKEGKIRFTGFSTHDAKVTLKQTLDNDFTQVILFIYNHMEGKKIEPLIQQVRNKGIGTIAVKVFAGRKQGNLKPLISQALSYPQAAIRWVLSNSHVDCCAVTMSSYSHVEEYIEASAKPLNRGDLKVIAEYQRQASNQYCRVSCRECLAACPNGTAINDILRYSMYFEDYGMEKEAMRYYAELEESKKSFKCLSCQGNCESACPHGLEVKEKLIRAHEILSI
jgi:hypothetical protein